jgi:polysaccharide export outer membrane protein
MKGPAIRQPLSLAIGLWCLLLLAVAASRAQDAESKVTPQLPEATQVPATGNDVSAGDASGNSEAVSSATADRNYVLGPEDVIDIEVFDIPELKRSVRVAADGLISVPLIGRVQAAGLTAEQLREELAEKWGENYLQEPQVTIFVKEFKAKPVSVIGAVEKPGLYPLSGRRSLIEMLSMAEGLGKKNTSPAGRTVLVTRQSGFKDLRPVDGMHVKSANQIEIDLNRLLNTRDEALNIEIKPLDIISVSRADVVYVIGAVNRPGGFVLEDRPSVTVFQAIAMANGCTGSAAKASARIVRKSEDGSQEEIPINLGKIMKGKAKDQTLAANDILWVPESKGKFVGRTAGQTGMAALMGWLIWVH